MRCVYHFHLTLFNATLILFCNSNLQAYDKGILEGRFLDGKVDSEESILRFSYVDHYSDEIAHLLGPVALKRVFNKKLEAVKAMKGAQEAEVNAAKEELRKISKLMKEKDTRVDTLQAENDALVRRVKELELMNQMEERRKKQKGEAFNLRQLLEEMKVVVTSGQYTKLSKAINLTMKEKHADRQTFQKNNVTHFYPDDKRLLELLVTTEMVGVTLAGI